MDWLKKHYDRVILAALGVIVLACAGVIIVWISGFNETFTGRNSPQRQNNNVPEPGTALVKERMDEIVHPKDWNVHDGSIFVSEPYILKEGSDEPVPIGREDSTPLFPPIENKWIMQFSLDFSDPNLPNADPDNDKFSNLEEFTGKTDPKDPKSIPPYYTKLRLLEFIKVPFRLIFSGSPDKGIYSINTLDLRGATQFLKIGEKVAGTDYKLIKYEEKTSNVNDMDIDASELTVENEHTGQKIVLVYDKAVDDPTVYAKFKYLWDGTEFKVKKLDSFSIKPEDNVKYKLIDISDERALITDPQGKEITVPKGS
jgi:hypothetical protein